MKIKSLIPALAALTFAVAASAQSDPSTGGSFGNSFGHSPSRDPSVTVTNQNPYKFVATQKTNAQNRSFWDKITGRNRTISHPGTNRSDRSHAWFHSNNGQHRGWFSRHDRSKENLQRNNSSWKSSRMNNTTTPKRSGWRIPFFHKT